MMRTKLLSCVVIVTILNQASVAQEWSTTANPSPPSTANMACDLRNRTMVMFGGGSFNLPGDSYNDVWVLDVIPGNEICEPLFPAGTLVTGVFLECDL